MSQAMPPEGWYPDPDSPADLRWWDGLGWTEARRPVGSTRWATGLVASVLGRRIRFAVAIGAALGAGTSLVIAVAALIRQEPAPGLPFLLLLGVPVVFVGQVWTIVSGWAREPRRTGSWLTRARARASDGARQGPRRFFFGDLGRTPAVGLLAVAVCGWLLAMTAFPSLVQGGPVGSRPGCPYALNSHGSLTCVNRREYQEAGAAEQRFAAGILLAFFCIHLGAAAGSLLHSGGAEPGPTRRSPLA